jgi:hypothetical protein
MSDSQATLATLAREVLGPLADAAVASAAGSTTWTRSGRTFAVLGPHGIEIRLDVAIAAAATRTPDTAPSPRGTDWVRFNPRALDGHAVDRLRAWLELAYRRAEA